MCSSSRNILVLLLFVGSLGSSAGINAQSDFREGYIIIKDLDTIHGQIAYRGDRRNAEACVFRCAPDFEIHEYKPFEIIAYRFNDNKYYISKSFELEGIRYEKFVEYLVDGTEELYYYKNRKGKYYLLEMKSQAPVVVSKELFETKYSEQFTNDREDIWFRETPPRTRLIMGAHTGIIFSQFHIEGNSEHSGSYSRNFDNMTIGLSLGMQFPRMSERIEFVLSSEYGKVNYTGIIEDFAETEKRWYYVHLRSGIVKNSFSAKYLFPTGRIQPIVEIGGIYQFLISPENSGTIEVYSTGNSWQEDFNIVPIPKTSLGFRTGTGVNYKPRKHLQVLLQLGFEYLHGTMNINVAPNNPQSTNVITINRNFDFYLRSGIKLYFPSAPFPYSYDPPPRHQIPAKIF